jgi:hypothetical protein
MLWCITADRQEKIGKAEKFRKIYEKRYESNIAWTNSALCASSSAIKRVTKGRIARMAQYWHFACASPAIKKWVNGLQYIFSK